MPDHTRMASLQHKAWLLMIIGVGALTSVEFWFSSHNTTTSFATLEQSRALRDGERARSLLQQELQNLSASGKDYAWRTDTVQFIAGKNLSHLNDNFTVDSMRLRKISGVLVFDVQGRLVGSTALTDEGVLGTPNSEVIEAITVLVQPVVGDSRSETVIDTFRQIAGALYLISVAPVLEQAGAGRVPSGAQVVFRRFGEVETNRFAQVILNSLNVSFEPMSEGAADLTLIKLHENRAEAHAVIRDHLNEPVARLVVSFDREIHQQAQSLVWTSALQVALTGILAGGLLVFLLDRLVLGRLLRLHTDLQQMSALGLSSGVEVRVDGKDELSQVSRGINVLLDRVRSDAKAQREDQEKHATQQLEIQRMEMQKTEALGRLTAGIAHDFNNSLAAITGWVRLALEDLETSHPSQEALQQASKATIYANGLTKQLLAFGRQSKPVLRRIRLSSLIEECRQLVATGLAKGCEVVVDCRVESDEVDADPTQLQQVLVNLVINAADAMKGRGRIELTVESLSLSVARGLEVPPATHGLPDGQYLVLKVRDHGPGIPSEIQSQIFDPFFTTKPKGKGTGLGLSVAQGVIARHHGTIGLSSDADGACFHIYLPISRRSPHVAPVTLPGELERGRQLLFVDDDQSVRHALSALLERKGWLVTRARDGQEAWNLYSKSGRHFDIVLTDQSMPNLDGPPASE